MSDSRIAALEEQLRQMDRLYRSATEEQQRTLRRNRETVRRQLQALRSVARRVVTS
jgi:hypothetical protein